MPSRLKRSSRRDSLVQHGSICARLVRDIGDATNLPYLKAVGGVSLIILETIQTVRANKEKCLRLTEQAYELICAIINVCRDTEIQLPPPMVRSIEHFTETLRRIVLYMERQVKGGIIRRIFRHMEDALLLEECNAGLKHALSVFGVQTGIIAAVTIADMQRDASRRHQELLTLITSRPSSSRRRHPPPSPSSGSRTPSRASTLSSLSSEGGGALSLSWSSEPSSEVDSLPPTPRSIRSITSIPKSKHPPDHINLLPPSPKIFKGRHQEIDNIRATLLRPSPARIAILGEEGAGKTSLATRILYDPEIMKVFEGRRHFIPCKNTLSLSDYLSEILDYFGLDPSRKPVKTIVRYLASMESPTLLILDNLDAICQDLDQRHAVEDFLSLLADIPHLSLIMTIRGNRRPRQIRWSRPFLPPLTPLSLEAAREVFIDISDVSPDDPQLGELLCIAEQNPKKLTIMASLASFETCASLLARWKTEGNSLFHDEYSIQTPICASPIQIC